MADMFVLITIKTLSLSHPFRGFSLTASLPPGDLHLGVIRISLLALRGVQPAVDKESIGSR
jgi:hypothetical protein